MIRPISLLLFLCCWRKRFTLPCCANLPLLACVVHEGVCMINLLIMVIDIMILILKIYILYNVWIGIHRNVNTSRKRSGDFILRSLDTHEMRFIALCMYKPGMLGGGGGGRMHKTLLSRRVFRIFQKANDGGAMSGAPLAGPKGS